MRRSSRTNNNAGPSDDATRGQQGQLPSDESSSNTVRPKNKRGLHLKSAPRKHARKGEIQPSRRSCRSRTTPPPDHDTTTTPSSTLATDTARTTPSSTLAILTLPLHPPWLLTLPPHPPWVHPPLLMTLTLPLHPPLLMTLLLHPPLSMVSLCTVERQASGEASSIVAQNTTNSAVCSTLRRSANRSWK